MDEGFVDVVDELVDITVCPPQDDAAAVQHASPTSTGSESTLLQLPHDLPGASSTSVSSDPSTSDVAAARSDKDVVRNSVVMMLRY